MGKTFRDEACAWNETSPEFLSTTDRMMPHCFESPFRRLSCFPVPPCTIFYRLSCIPVPLCAVFYRLSYIPVPLCAVFYRLSYIPVPLCAVFHCLSYIPVPPCVAFYRLSCIPVPPSNSTTVWGFKDWPGCNWWHHSVRYPSLESVWTSDLSVFVKI